MGESFRKVKGQLFMNGRESQRLLRGALLLTLAGIISKILSAGYRIPLQNLTGDIGFYVYQQVYPVLGMAAVLGLYGFPTAVSRLAVDVKERGYTISLRGFYVPVFILLTGFSSIAFLLLYINAGNLAALVGDPELSKVYRWSAFLFLLLPITSVLRGTLQANSQMEPTAFSQVGEQLVRVSLIIIAAVLVSLHGLSVYTIGSAAVFASAVGAGAAIIILAFFLAKQKPQAKGEAVVPWLYMGKTLLMVGVVAALNHMVLLTLQLADTLTLIPALREYGLSLTEAMEAKGVFDRGQPLIQLGTVLGSSFALALIPEISQKRVRKQWEAVQYEIQGALLVSFYLASGAAVGLITIFPEANILLYQNDNGSTTLQILALSILLCSLSVIGTALLQGAGAIKRTASFIAIALLAKWAGNLVFVPWWGIAGSAWATVISLLLLCLMVYSSLTREFPGLKFFEKIRWRTLLAALTIMVIYLIIMEMLLPARWLDSRVSLLFYIMFVSCSGGAFYLYILVRGHAFTEEQLHMLPLSKLFIHIHRGRKIDGQK
ncbi:oligosaccharide flippase family protein [Virgibacillus xinjiangensis]|uniref:Oligosaccharide flippase family protein n=1 Tax=Virgibacillus xinjiangensis TaxID=393090 RepID=A0ABV7CX97_9BACI